MSWQSIAAVCAVTVAVGRASIRAALATSLRVAPAITARALQPEGGRAGLENSSKSVLADV